MVRRFNDITPRGSCRQTTSLDSWHALLLLKSFNLSPCLSLSPPLLLLLLTSSPPSSSPSLYFPVFYLTLYLGCFFFCQRASLITAEPSFSAFPWEWRSFLENEMLVTRKCSRLSKSWTKANSNGDNCHYLICSFSAFSGMLSTEIFKRRSTAEYRPSLFLPCIFCLFRCLWSWGKKKWG